MGGPDHPQPQEWAVLKGACWSMLKYKDCAVYLWISFCARLLQVLPTAGACSGRVHSLLHGWQCGLLTK